MGNRERGGGGGVGGTKRKNNRISSKNIFIPLKPWYGEGTHDVVILAQLPRRSLPTTLLLRRKHWG